MGVNKFQDAHDIEPQLNSMDMKIETHQIAVLKEFKLNRDKIKVDASISRLPWLQRGIEDGDLMPYILQAVKNHITLGEISDTFEEIFGRYEPRVSF